MYMARTGRRLAQYATLAAATLAGAALTLAAQLPVWHPGRAVAVAAVGALAATLVATWPRTWGRRTPPRTGRRKAPQGTTWQAPAALPGSYTAAQAYALGGLHALRQQAKARRTAPYGAGVYTPHG